ncbi:hypothetical protein ACFLRY_03560 [Bacteroidota bacterium]
MKYLTILLFMVFYVFACYAQQDKRTNLPPIQEERSSIDVVESKDAAVIDFAGGSSYKPNYLGEKSSIYLFEDWQLANITLNNGKIIENIPIRYDLYNQQMQFIDDEDTLAFANPGEINHINVGDSRFVYIEFVDNSAVDNTFMEVLSDGDCKLLEYNKLDYFISSDNSCIVSKHFYIKKDSNPAEEVALKCKYVVSAFPGEENEIRDYIKKNKLKFKTCKDLCKVVEYYNSFTQHP